MKALRTFAAAGAMVAAVGTASAQTAAPAPAQPDPAAVGNFFNQLADAIQAGTNKYCKAEFDGDKSKGELTNADVADIIRHAAKIPELHERIPLQFIAQTLATGAQNDYTICFDRRVKAVTADNMPEEARPLLAQTPLNAVIYPSVDVIAMTPVPVDAKDPKRSAAVAIFDSFHRLSQINNGLERLAAEGNIPMVMMLMSTPFAVLHNAAAPWQSQSGPAGELGAVMAEPPIKPQEEQGTSSTPSRGTPTQRGVHTTQYKSVNYSFAG